jgi:hypothetical protein
MNNNIIALPVPNRLPQPPTVPNGVPQSGNGVVLPGARPYNMSAQIYNQGGNIDRQKRCFAFMFTNVGDAIAYVNEMVIFPATDPTTSLGDSRSISATDLVEYKGVIQLRFAAGATPAVEIVQLFYVD